MISEPKRRSKKARPFKCRQITYIFAEERKMTRIASYNIRKSVGLDYRRDPLRVLSVLSAIDADVVALQEVDRRFGRRASSIPRDLLAENTNLKIVELAKRPDSIGWHGNAVLVRQDAEVMDIHNIDLPGLEPRGAVVVDLDLPGTSLRVVGVHLSLMRRDRRVQVTHITEYLARLSALPTLIMGDFNEWSQTSQNLTALSERFNLHTPGHSFPSSRPVVGLDKIALSRDLAFSNSGVHTCEASKRASDHMPIWADIRAS